MLVIMVWFCYLDRFVCFVWRHPLTETLPLINTYPPMHITTTQTDWGVCLTWGMSNSKRTLPHVQILLRIWKNKCFWCDILDKSTSWKKKTFQYDDANFDADVVVSTYWCYSVKSNNTPLNAADRGKAVGKGGSKLRLMLRLKILEFWRICRSVMPSYTPILLHTTYHVNIYTCVTPCIFTCNYLWCLNACQWRCGLQTFFFGPELHVYQCYSIILLTDIVTSFSSVLPS